MTKLEIAVTSVAGARVAHRCGATRIELCAALELGGVTPSDGLVRTVTAAVGPADPARGWEGVHVLVRPRPGDFVYDADELTTYRAEIEAVLALGVDGVVIGALTANAEVDKEVLISLAAPARAIGATVTFHRAIDRTPDPVASARELVGLVDRVLTSGGAAAAGEGIDALSRMAAIDGLDVIASGGARVDQIPALVSCGVSAIHLSAKRIAGRRANPLGVADTGLHYVTDPDIVDSAARSMGLRSRRDR